MSARGFVETAPRAFELALHFVSALRQGVFGMVLSHAWAAGHPLAELSGHDLASRTGRTLDAIVGGDFMPLAARAWVGTFDARADSGEEPEADPSEEEAPDGAASTHHEAVESLAVVDAALAGSGWFAAGRFVWSAVDFAESPCARRHEHLVLAVDDPADDALRAYRLRTDDVVAQAAMGSVRHAVLRELVLRPAFAEVTQSLVGVGGGHAHEESGGNPVDDRHI